jgi:putative peptidoglycan lipid II flippase
VLNTWREFKMPAFTPVLWNLSSIVAALFLVPYSERADLCDGVAVMVGGVLQIAVQIPALERIGMLPRLSFNPLAGLRDAGVRRILRKMGPAVFAVSAAQISLLINTNIASRLGVGAVSWLQYADRLMEFPTALLGVALGTILLPSLSKAQGRRRRRRILGPARLGPAPDLPAGPARRGRPGPLSEPLIAGLFHYGAFDAHSVPPPAQPLMAYAVGLLGLILVKILAPAFYARQDIRTPVRIAVGVLIATQLLNLRVRAAAGQVAGLALSIGAGACLNAAFLFTGLRRSGTYVAAAGLAAASSSRWWWRSALMAALAAWFSRADSSTGSALRAHRGAAPRRPAGRGRLVRLRVLRRAVRAGAAHARFQAHRALSGVARIVVRITHMTRTCGGISSLSCDHIVIRLRP